ncbi:phosphotransferase family protein [Streptomyces sp. WI04-05B]|uniref:phosphotransferase family protein n=1 Tax=Streptomyces TaxID=1883 RepID=UPI0029BC5BEF|nr:MULTISPECIES: aminoglycoside phosphotransferase family protein [unclassified Streptomyces]MDX2547920.1 aminoglycoside phosphotransferase family protein [Streptomyces sp. WI04-05B]MDX2582781.1 aminoglycoside phosphotransferase family protein [Streptomyces sp. WI04-05A]
MTDSWERARQVLGSAGLPPDQLVDCRPLTGGTYNTVEDLRLVDGSRYVLKIPPPETVPGLRHESRLLVSEAEFYRAADTVGVPAPSVVALGDGHLLMTACPGAPWDDSTTGAERALLRAELGGLVARLHQVTGSAFGYPSGALGPLAPDWRTAFTAMLDAVLDDAVRYDAWLPVPVDEVARSLRAAYDALDEVTVPRLVHFDLWDGNILVDRSAGAPRVGGLIDGERMFWGDPVADFVSLALLGDIRGDAQFLTGYQKLGGQVEFDYTTCRRLALYRAYLYLIMLTETVPRAVGEERVRWTRDVVGPALTDALADL